MKSFIKIVEVWVPASNGPDLVLADAIYDRYKKFFLASRKTRFSYGEGLPGKAWEMAAPQLISDLENSYFLRKSAAAEAGLTAGIAIPIFAGEFLLAVLVFLCGDDSRSTGAIELWSNKEGDSKQLSLVDGYYGSLSSLRQTSQIQTFAKGEGLPGHVWDYHIPLIVTDMLNSPHFQRGGHAMVDGITSAIAFPFNSVHGDEFVVSLLSTKATPIARRVEIWLPDRDLKTLTMQYSYCEFDKEHQKKNSWMSTTRNSGVIGQTWATGRPVVSSDLIGDGLCTSENIYELNRGFTLPVIEAGVLTSIVAIML